MTIDELNKVMEEADCLHTEAEVEAVITRVAEEISQEMQHALPLVYCVMNGGLIFAGKLLLKLRFPLEACYLHATRYQGSTRGGELHWKVAPADSLQGRTVLIVDDILDEGATLKAIVSDCLARGADRV
jgi:hypoxanthine phosphoribosyltransferase